MLEDSSWLADHEDDGGTMVEFTREISHVSAELRLPALDVFTVTLAGPEREFGEVPFRYVLHAATLADTRVLAATFHTTHGAEADYRASRPSTAHGVQIIDGPHETFPGAPPWPADLPGRPWTDLRINARLLTAAYDMTTTRSAHGT